MAPALLLCSDSNTHTRRSNFIISETLAWLIGFILTSAMSLWLSKTSNTRFIVRPKNDLPMMLSTNVLHILTREENLERIVHHPHPSISAPFSDRAVQSLSCRCVCVLRPWGSPVPCRNLYVFSIASQVAFHPRKLFRPSCFWICHSPCVLHIILSISVDTSRTGAVYRFDFAINIW